MDDREGCPITRIYALKSGVPVIGLGLFLVLVGMLGVLLPSLFPIGPVGVLIFTGFGIFLVWIGLTN